MHRKCWASNCNCAFNSLAPGKFELNFRHVIFKQILMIDGWRICCRIALIWMSLDYTDDQSTLVQVMAWCRQATSHYLSQSSPRSLLPYGITRPQWVICTTWSHTHCYSRSIFNLCTLCMISAVTGLYSEWSVVRMINSPKGHWSEWSIVLRIISPNGQ